jgi:drug/metabolite transporter (DMT)-like permease
LAGVLTGEWAAFSPGAVSVESLVALAYLTVIGSLVAFTTFGWLLRVAPLQFVATYAYVNPVVAVVLGVIVLNEALTARTIVAGIIIVFAVALIITTRGRMRAPARASRPAPDGAAVVAPPGEPARTSAG